MIVHSVVFNTPGRESGGSWFETCLGVWYPRRRPCGVAINTLVDLHHEYNVKYDMQFRTLLCIIIYSNVHLQVAFSQIRNKR